MAEKTISLPPVPAGLSPELKAFLEALRSAVLSQIAANGGK